MLVVCLMPYDWDYKVAIVTVDLNNKPLLLLAS